MFFKYFSILLAALLAPLAGATNYEELAPSVLSLRMGMTMPVIPLTLQAPKDSSLKSLQYNQNSNAKLGVGLDYSWMGFFISVDDMQSDLDTATYGQSKYQDFQFHSYMGAIGVDFFFQDFKGYYLQNTTEITGAACCSLRDDLSSRFIGGNLFLLLNPKRLSMGTANNLTGVQKKSGGSWMLFASGSKQEIKSNQVFAPSGYENRYGILGNAKFASFTTATAGLGYGYTGMLAGPLFFHTTVLVGLGPQLQKIETRDHGFINESNGAAKISLRSTLGWSGQRTFGGIQLLFDSTNFQLKGEALTFNSILTFLSMGFRI